MKRMRRSVLVVEADADERERLATALERSGFDVLLCSGPTSPDYTCVGGREGSCPLVDPAEVVVLDLWLESDTMLTGTSSQELLQLYLSAGKPVITLGTPDGSMQSFSGTALVHLGRMPDPAELVQVVETIVSTARRSQVGEMAEGEA